MNELIKSYLDAEYVVDGFDNPLKIGETSEELDALLEEEGVSTWCFITAVNPSSEQLTPAENISRNEKLREDLRAFKVLNGEGRDPKGSWKPEHSFLVLGIDLDTTVLLAEKYNQKAIVFGKKADVAEMIVREDSE